jgi:glutamate/tyrosine decarboxylase-like PLP-dependent enzyme
MHSRDLLTAAAGHAADFLETLPEGRVEAEVLDADDLRARLALPLPQGPTDARTVLDELVAAATPGLVRSQSPRYFGYVIGGTLPAALAADVVVAGWDQNAGGYSVSPAASVVEEVAGGWLLDLLGLPAGASFGLTTGCQQAHVTCLAAARNAVLARVGWDAESGGLQGAPRVRVLVSEERHVTIDRAARILGFGTAALVAVAVDAAGRMDPAALRDALAAGEGPAIVCAQAGDVNTGAFDPLPEIVDAAHAAGAWVHIDGAFGLWAAASPDRRHLLDGYAGADSWATDAHKWLNVPHDCGLAFVADPEPHRNAMVVSAAYLRGSREGERDGSRWVPDFSRRGRGFAVYAALRSLGARGGRRDGRPLLCVRAALRRGPRRRRRRRGAQRRRPQPGARPLRRRRDDRRGGRRRPGRGHVLDEPDDLARAAGDTHLGVQLGDDDQRRGSLVRVDPQGRAPAGGGPDGTAARLTGGCPLQRAVVVKRSPRR